MEFLTYLGDTIPLWLVFTLFSVIVAYWYLTKDYKYWKLHNIPYVKPLPIVGTMASIMKYPFHEIGNERHKKMGPVYGTYEGRKPILNVGDPDILKDILVKDFQFFTGRRTFKSGSAVLDKMVSNLKGEDWKRVRTLITPAFTTGKIKKMIGIFIDSAKTVTENFRKTAEEGKPADMKRYFGAFTMDVIASSAFGTKIDSHNDPENPFVSSARKAFTRGVSWRLFLMLVLPILTKLLRNKRSFGLENVEFFKDAALKILEDRKKSGKKRNDFLQLMMDAAKEELEKDAPVENDKETDIGHEENNEQVFKPIYSSKTLSNDEMVAQCVVFFLAGYDTTASTLSFTAYELALNPEIQDRAIAEIDEAVNKTGELQYEAISEMKYLDCIISETLRKYPPATGTERTASDDYHIKSLNFTVTKDMTVGIPIYAIHHDPKYYPDPEKYDPDRFTPEQKATRHPYSYLPFGAGPRNCIAMRFALMEVKVCLAYVLSQCRFSVSPETKIPLEYRIGTGLMQPKEVMLKVDIRNREEKL